MQPPRARPKTAAPVDRPSRGAGSKKATPIALPTDPHALVYRRRGHGQVSHFHSTPDCMLRGQGRSLRLAAALAAEFVPCSICWIVSCPHGAHVLYDDCMPCEAATPCCFDSSHMESECTCSFEVTLLGKRVMSSAVAA